MSGGTIKLSPMPEGFAVKDAARPTGDPKPLTGQGNTRKALGVLNVTLVALCIVLLAVAGARWAAGRPSSTVSTVGVGQSGHAKVEAVGKTGLHRVVLTPEAAVAARAGYGGTAPLRVAEQLARLRRTLDEQRGWAAQYGGPRRP